MREGGGNRTPRAAPFLRARGAARAGPPTGEEPEAARSVVHELASSRPAGPRVETRSRERLELLPRSAQPTERPRIARARKGRPVRHIQRAPPEAHLLRPWVGPIRSRSERLR
eukprot:351236-Chlamydomonas_euryale.AAC.7